MHECLRSLRAGIREARESDNFREEIAGEIESYIDERSDAWREGEKGDAYNEWLSSWQESFEEVDIDEPRAIDEPETDTKSLLADLEPEPNI